MLEAVVSQDLWIWHAFFGIAGANNDINVLDNSSLFDDLLDDLAPAVLYVVNGVEYRNEYYLADGIYPEWASFVKSFTVATDPKHTYFKQRHESARKDVERAFGVLQGRWRLIQQPARAYEVNTLRRIMNMFGASLVSQAKVSSFQIYAKAVGAKNGGEAKEIDRIVGFGFGYGDVGNCEGFGNAVVLNADHSPFESVESAIVDDDGVKHILLCRVLLGKTEVVNRFSTQCHPSSEEFDSGVDNEVSPKKYIIWSSQMNTHILPEFVISFKTQRIANRPEVNGVRLEKPVSPWIPIPDLIAKLSKMLPPKSIKEIREYRHSYIQRKITRLDMIRGIKGIAGDRMLLMVLKDFTEKRRVNHPGSIYNQVK
nr:probable inactive poly [ADP-ribose] polymerase SRO5 [Tanacetum cinerariifolium]